MKQKLWILSAVCILGTFLGTGCGDTNLAKTRPDTGWNVEEDLDTDFFDADHSDSNLNDTELDDDDTNDGEDATQPNIRTISDYRLCESDSDCPVGLGSCVKEIALNRADSDGTQSVAIDEIFESLEPGQGICTFVCTNNPDACTNLSVNGTMADPAPHVCQIIVQGSALYPEIAPAFPFDDQLNPAALAAGQAFGAICRPPFELHADIASSMCTPCQGPDSCGDSNSICWNMLHQAPAQEDQAGTCLSACDDTSQCPLGFACDAQEGDQKYCRPLLDTCTACRDLDGDGFGTGRCGDAIDPVTPYDCDDANPLAYFNPDNMKHPFPTHCSTQDFNCNGISDDIEQIGAQNFPEEHCTACFDTCQDALPNGQYACRNLGTMNEPQYACITTCERDTEGKLLFADCDGDPTNGCEIPTDDISRQYYRDIDGDGFGDPNDVVFACDTNIAPAGYVSNNLDCNDSSPAAHGGPNPPAEICDGLDNDCNGQIDDGLAQVGTACSTGLPGVCSTGTWQCAGVQGFVCEPDIHPGTLPEICDGLDNNCDGQIDENWPQDGTTPPVDSNYNAYFTDNDNDGFTAANATTPLYACSKPARYSLKSAEDDCDDNNANIKGPRTFYKDQDQDSFGVATDSISACNPSGVYTATQTGDCNDNNASVHPGATERCNGIDDNCNNQTDETFDIGATCSRGVGECMNTGVMICTNQTSTDCSVTAGTPTLESCNGYDDNCNGKTDEGCPVANSTLTTGSMVKRGEVGIIYNFIDAKTYTCPGNKVLIGAEVYQEIAYDDIQRISLICADLITARTSTYNYNINRSSAPVSYVAGPEYTYKTYKERYQGQFICPANSVVSKIDVRKDTHHITWISFSCRSLTLNIQPGQFAASTSLTPGMDVVEASFGNINKGDPQFPVPDFGCRNDEVAVGFHAAPDKQDGGSDALTYIALQCRKISVPTISP